MLSVHRGNAGGKNVDAGFACRHHSSCFVRTKFFGFFSGQESSPSGRRCRCGQLHPTREPSPQPLPPLLHRFQQLRLPRQLRSGPPSSSKMCSPPRGPTATPDAGPVCSMSPRAAAPHATRSVEPAAPSGPSSPPSPSASPPKRSSSRSTGPRGPSSLSTGRMRLRLSTAACSRES